MRNRKALIAVILSAVILAVGCSSDNSTSTTAPGTSLVSGSESTANSSATEAQSNVSTTPTVTTTVAPETTPAVTTTAKPAEQTTVATTTTKKQETTKPAESTVATTKATTVATTTAKPAPEWTEEKVSATKYVNTDCYSRKKAVLGAETVKIYNVNDKVNVVAKTNTGYFKLDTGAFIHGDYLSDRKVAVQTTTTTVVTTKKPVENKPVNDDAPDYGAIPEPWTEDDIWYVFDTVEKYAKSKGYNGCDFPRKVTHYSDKLGLWSFGEFGDYSVVGKVWAYGSTGADEFVFYDSYDKKKNIDYFISNMKLTVDEKLKHTFPDWKVYKITVTTGKDMLRLYEHEGMTQDEYPEDEIFNCNANTAYVFVLNH